MSLLITIEGLDGTGKSTLAKELRNAISQDPAFCQWVYQTKEPGNQIVFNNDLKFDRPGPNIRDIVLNETGLVPFERELLFYADASLHRRFIEDQGSAIVLSDRGVWSHLAYLRGYLKTKQINYDDYNICKNVISRVCAEPDCIVYLSGSIELMKERLKGKPQDAIEANGDGFFSAVLETYEDLIKDRQWRDKPLIILDSRETTYLNRDKVIDYLKGAFDGEQLRLGDREIC